MPEREISIEYSLFLDDGSKVDSNVGQEPLTYREGAGQILPALEHQIADLEEGESKRVVLAAEDAYGPKNPDAFRQVETEAIPEEAREPGAMLVAEDGEGHRHQVRVHEVKDDGIVLDLNHPLAGQTLTFDVKVVGIK
jgi:FKBP-type peptidyl-prolyl cis-trans isomerase SlyD